MATVKVDINPETEAVYLKDEIEAVFKKLDELNTLQHDQRVLIIQAVKTINSLSKVFPGIKTGNIGSGINFTDIMSIGSNSDVISNVTQLGKLIDEYEKRNPIPIT